ncbi:Crp/Fnr family transcriptional regulator [Flagellimonas lutimaris]|uniref:Crp/Fnr family transcriptional regulator n=1 Tax=Flagellimonas lutimaris TaxID=475082 RepID=UPI0016010E7D|nr:Crp/Fnr family transcriptional regulator [Allomuricauda lutimaris]
MNIVEYIQKHIDDSFCEEELPFKVSKRTLKKGEIICDYNQIENNVYFLQKGIIQANIENSNGDIRIVDFFFQEDFVCSYTSLLNSAPSDVQMIATTDCDVEIVSAMELAQAYEHSLLANQLGRKETEKLYLRKVRREKELLTLTGEERYLRLITLHPEITNQVSIGSIAKYLGIHPESLSRIRRNLVKPSNEQ